MKRFAGLGAKTYSHIKKTNEKNKKLKGQKSAS